MLSSHSKLFSILLLISFIVLQTCQSSSVCRTREGLFAHPTIRTSFIQCNEGIPYVKPCPASLVWNQAKQVCDWPDSVTSGQSWKNGNDLYDQLPQESSQVQTGGRPTGARRPNVHLPVGVKIDPITHQITGFPCPVLNGMLQIEEDCGRFVHCERGVGYLKDCPIGLQFDAKNSICNWPDNVKCKSSGKANKNTFKVVKPHYLNNYNPTSPRPDWNNIPAQNLNPIAPPIGGGDQEQGERPSQTRPPKPTGSERPYPPPFSQPNNRPDSGDSIAVELPEEPDVKPEVPPPVSPEQPEPKPKPTGSSSRKCRLYLNWGFKNFVSINLI